eukprot:c20075_g1_i2.p1 GENE.c20075_g1_i2~~c20075_g1_i2.p1  ORF type:complete len:704 (+),score=128.17 c20075_g1_i2:39-2114(+)
MEELDSDALLQGEAQSDWVALRDLDTFCRMLYTYHLEKGFWALVAHRVLTLTTFGFTISVSSLLMLFVNWHGLFSECSSPESCAQVETFVSPFAGNLIWSLVVSVYALVLSLGWCFLAFRFFKEIKYCLEIRYFYNVKLRIPEGEIGTVEWSEVMARVVQYQQQHALSHDKQLSELDIANRLMRRDNFLIAILNRGLLDPPLSFMPKRLMLTKTMEWNLSLCLLHPMFDEQHQIHKKFLNNVSGLRRRILMLAIANFFLAPFVLCGVLIHFFLKYAERFKSRPSALGSCQYSRCALWLFREFNELPHVFERRIARSLKMAELYVEQFPMQTLSSIARLFAFVSGACAAVLLLLGLLNDDLLLNYRIPNDHDGKNLLWYLAVLTGASALFRSFVVDKTTTQVYDRAETMAQIVLHTHYSPAHWQNKYHTHEVFVEFSSLYCFKAQLFMEEILSIFITPLILFHLRHRAADMLSFVTDFSDDVPGVGHVCSFAMFDFAHHGDSRFGAASSCNESRQSRLGKMEKSYLNFKVEHPRWDVPGGAELLENISKHASNSTLLPPTFLPPSVVRSTNPPSPPSAPPLPISSSATLQLPSPDTDGQTPSPLVQHRPDPLGPGLGATSTSSQLWNSHALLLNQGSQLSAFPRGLASMQVGESYFAWVQQYCEAQSSLHESSGQPEFELSARDPAEPHMPS